MPAYLFEAGGTVVFFETSENEPSPSKVDALSMDFDGMGVLENLSPRVASGRALRASATLLDRGQFVGGGKLGFGAVDAHESRAQALQRDRDDL